MTINEFILFVLFYRFGKDTSVAKTMQTQSR